MEDYIAFIHRVLNSRLLWWTICCWQGCWILVPLIRTTFESDIGDGAVGCRS